MRAPSLAFAWPTSHCWAIALNVVALLMNGRGLWLAITAIITESTARNVPLEPVERLRRLRDRLRRRKDATVVAVTGQAHMNMTASLDTTGVVSQAKTDDPAENRLRRIEDTLAYLRADVTAAQAAAESQHRRLTDAVEKAEERVNARIDTAESRERETSSSVLTQEMRGLAWVGAGTFLAGLVQLFTL